MSRSDFGFSEEEPRRASAGRLVPPGLDGAVSREPLARFEEGDLLDYGRMLWARRRMILIGTLAAALLGAAAAALLPKTYRGTAMLLIAESKMWTLQEEQKDIPPHKYIEIVRSRTVASRVIGDLKLGQPPHLYDEDRLLQRLKVIPIEGSMLLRITVEARDPDLARDIANAIVGHSIAVNRSLSTGDTAAANTFVKSQLQDAAKRFDAAGNALRSFTESAKLEEVRALVDTELELKEELSLQLAQVEQDISRTRGAVETMTAELKGQKKILDLVKSLSDDATFQQVAQGASKEDLQRMLAIRMTSEQINPLYQELEPKLVEGLGDVAGWQRQRRTIQSALAENGRRLGTLQQELARKNAEYERLDTVYEIEQESYKTFARKQAEVGLLTQVKDADLQVVDPAVSVRRHVRPKVWIYTALSGTIAFVVLVLLALVLEYANARRAVFARAGQARPLPEIAASR